MADTLCASSPVSALDTDGWTVVDQGQLIVPHAWPDIQMWFYWFSAGADLIEQCCPHHAMVQFLSGSDPWQRKEDGDPGGTLLVCLLMTLPPEISLSFGFLHVSKAEKSAFMVVPTGESSSAGATLAAAITQISSFRS
ncbi:hypothetical protein llap_1468 [Limosa lapponica baueri]|uniref:Uncharacterized protein n=1 Tax=Limosa lapponica baueri TaxID=1758121 RepID=A0A2I0UQ68_LIMLA|nr:hypothetical protein llap_1468 [Limosa lapponica baueri]